jgi:hypothetical protein
MLGVLYAGTFFLLSAITAVVFFAFRKLRPYTPHAFVVPLAFGGASICGMFAIVFFENFVLGVNVLPEGRWALVIHIALGLFGAAIAIYVLNFLQCKFRAVLHSPPTSRRIRPF